MEEPSFDNTKLRVLRIGKNWSQEYIAEKMGLTQAAYSKLESGQTKLTIDRAEKLANIYEIYPESFFSNRQIINHNNGSSSVGIVYADNFYENRDSSIQKDFLEKSLRDKDKVITMCHSQISALQLELRALRKEKDQLMKIIIKLSDTLAAK
jgi:transcriptional regulator with XRE-family HTH domain